METVRVERDGPLAVVTLDRPAAKNSFDVATDQALFEAVRAVARDAPVKAVVLTGVGKVFCTGADVVEMQKQAARAADHFDDLTLPYHATLQAIRDSDAVWVAAVNGVAAGGGVGLALSCDLAVMARGARFVLAYGNLGVSPDGGSTSHLTRILGPMRAREAVLIDGGIAAEQALAWGLVNRVVDDGEVLAAARALAQQAGARALHTRRSTKRLVEAASTETFDRTLELERRGIIEAARSPDFAEGLAAFREKRAAKFR